MNLIPRIIQIYLFMNPYQLSAMYQEDRTAPRSTFLDNLAEVLCTSAVHILCWGVCTLANLII